MMVEADLTKLVDDDGAVGHPDMAEQAVEQCGLATAKKTGDDRNRQARGGTIWIEQAHGALTIGDHPPY